jgi:hypothetical protein
MVDMATFRKLALAFAEAVEEPHFEKTSFRYRKKIFATANEKDNTAVLKLSLINQAVFCSYNGGVVFRPVPGAWGKKGFTIVQLATVRKDMFADALCTAYEEVSMPKPKQ